MDLRCSTPPTPFGMRPASPTGVKGAGFQLKNEYDHGQKMFNVIKNSWKNKWFCDVELVVGREEKVISAHKMVLVSFCEYFRGLFNPTMREGNQTSIRCLEHLDADVVVKMIEFCYTGSIHLNDSKDHSGIEELLKAADYMHLQEVCKHVALFLLKHLSEENCLGFLQCADHYSLTELRKRVFNYSCRNFSKVCKGEEFRSLPLPFLKELLQSERLIVQEKGFVIPTTDQEECIIESVLKYVLHNQANRLQKLPELLRLLKLPLLTTSQIENLERNKLVAGCEECLTVTKEAKATKAVKVLDDGIKGFNWARRRNNQDLLLREQCVYAGSGKVRPEMAKFSCREVHEGDREAFVTGLKLGFRRWDGRLVLGGLQVLYSTGQSPKHGMDPWTGLSTCEQMYEVNLAHNERIVRVDVRSSQMIDRLTFFTNLGNTFGPWGGDGGTAYTERPPTINSIFRQQSTLQEQKTTSVRRKNSTLRSDNMGTNQLIGDQLQEVDDLGVFHAPLQDPLHEAEDLAEQQARFHNPFHEAVDLGVYHAPVQNPLQEAEDLGVQHAPQQDPQQEAEDLGIQQAPLQDPWQEAQQQLLMRLDRQMQNPNHMATSHYRHHPHQDPEQDPQQDPEQDPQQDPEQGPQQEEEESQVPQVKCMLAGGYLAGISGTVVTSQGAHGITRLRLMWGVYNFSDDLRMETIPQEPQPLTIFGIDRPRYSFFQPDQNQEKDFESSDYTDGGYSMSIIMPYGVSDGLVAIPNDPNPSMHEHIWSGDPEQRDYAFQAHYMKESIMRLT